MTPEIEHPLLPVLVEGSFPLLEDFLVESGQDFDMFLKSVVDSQVVQTLHIAEVALESFMYFSKIKGLMEQEKYEAHKICLHFTTKISNLLVERSQENLKIMLDVETQFKNLMQQIQERDDHDAANDSGTPDVN